MRWENWWLGLLDSCLGKFVGLGFGLGQWFPNFFGLWPKCLFNNDSWLTTCCKAWAQTSFKVWKFNTKTGEMVSSNLFLMRYMLLNSWLCWWQRWLLLNSRYSHASLLTHFELRSPTQQLKPIVRSQWPLLLINNYCFANNYFFQNKAHNIYSITKQ